MGSSIQEELPALIRYLNAEESFIDRIIETILGLKEMAVRVFITANHVGILGQHSFACIRHNEPVEFRSINIVNDLRDLQQQIFLDLKNMSKNELENQIMMLLYSCRSLARPSWGDMVTTDDDQREYAQLGTLE